MSASANGKRGSRLEERRRGKSDRNRRGAERSSPNRHQTQFPSFFLPLFLSSPLALVAHLSSLAPPPSSDLPVAGPRWLGFHLPVFIFLHLLACSIRKWGVSSLAFYEANLLYILLHITVLMWLFSSGRDTFPKTPNSPNASPSFTLPGRQMLPHFIAVSLRYVLPSCSLST